MSQDRIDDDGNSANRPDFLRIDKGGICHFCGISVRPCVQVETMRNLYGAELTALVPFREIIMVCDTCVDALTVTLQALYHGQCQECGRGRAGAVQGGVIPLYCDWNLCVECLTHLAVHADQTAFFARLREKQEGNHAS
jgi:hypothetical protein